MGSPRRVRLAQWVFRVSQRLYPAGFRRRYGREIMRAFSALAREQSGWGGLFVLTTRGVVDAIRAAAVEHRLAWAERRTWRRRRRFTEPAGELLASMVRDVRLSVRTLSRRPGFAAASVVTLGLGIGANTAIFSVVNGVLLRPLPYEDGGNLIVMQQQSNIAGKQNFSVQEINDFRAHSETLKDVVEYHSLWFSLVGRGDPERVLSGVVSWQFFDLMGVTPILGRAFRPEDDELGAPPVLVLSHGYWLRSFGGDSSVVGQTVRMNEQVYTIVGVLPPVPQYPRENDVYMPTVSCPFRSSTGWIDNRNVRALSVFCRVEPGVNPERLKADLASVASRMRNDHPEAYPGYGESHSIATSSLQTELTRRAHPTLLVLFVTVGLVLLIACANVANLTLSTFVRREREMAVRAALGASRGRITRQLITESTILTLAGGILGLVVAAAGLDLLISFAKRFTPRAGEITIDGVVLGFAFVVAVATGIAFGLFPALTRQSEVADALREGGQRATGGTTPSRARSVLVVSQLALSFVLLISAGLMVRTLIQLQKVDQGFDSENVVTMALATPFTRPFAETVPFYERLVERVRGFPGVEAAAVGTAFPLSENTPASNGYDLEGRMADEDERRPLADLRLVGDGYFDAIRQPVIMGRSLSARDDSEAPAVVVINHALANRRFPGENPLGQRITLNRGQTWLEIVGVVGDVRQHGLGSEIREELYLSFSANGSRNASLLIRTRGNPFALAEQVRGAIRDLDPEVPVADVKTLEEVRQDSLASPRLTTTLLALFAVLALVITSTGVAAVIGFSVSQRTKEIGIRMALGARQTAVLGMILRQGMAHVAIGLAVGLGGSLVITRLLSGLLFGVAATDPLTFVTVVLVLSGVAVTAIMIPARRATTIDPLRTLRAD